MSRKSQAAMEFLMTYGWAILVVLVAIGALAYFGVLSPDKFLPSRCTLPAGIACVDHEVTQVEGGSGNVYIVVRNALGYDIKTVSVSASGCTGGTSEELIRNGGDPVALVAYGCTVTSGEKYSGDINVTYTNSDTGLEHKVRGTVIARVRGGAI